MSSFMVPFIIAFIAVWTLIIFGTSHVSFRQAINNEVKNTHYENTSNNLRPFTMQVDSCRVKPTGKELTGVLKGNEPEKGDIVFIENEGERKAVYIKSVKRGKNTEWAEGVNIVMTVFGAGKLPYNEKAVVTNVRKDVIKTDGIDIRYPVIVKSMFSDVIWGIVMAIVGLIGLPMSVYSESAVFVILFCCMFVMGILLVWYNVTFRFEFTDSEHVKVHSGFTSNVYHIYNLQYRVSSDVNKQGTSNITIFNNGNKQLCMINSRNPKYAEILSLMRKMVKDRDTDRIAKAIANVEFFVPTDLIANRENANMTMVQILSQKETKNKRLFAYDTEENMKKYAPVEYFSYMKASAADIIDMTAEFTLCNDIKLIYTLKDEPMFVIIDRESRRNYRGRIEKFRNETVTQTEADE